MAPGLGPGAARAAVGAGDSARGPITTIDTSGFHQARRRRSRSAPTGSRPATPSASARGDQAVGSRRWPGSTARPLVTVTLPEGHRDAAPTCPAPASREGQPLTFRVLDAKRLPVKVKSRVAKGGTQVVKIRGLAKGESFKVSYRGKRVDEGTANAKGRGGRPVPGRPEGRRGQGRGARGVQEPPGRQGLHRHPMKRARPPRRRGPGGRGGGPRPARAGGVRRSVHRRQRRERGRRLQRPRRRRAAGLRARGRWRPGVVAVPGRRVPAELRLAPAGLRVPGQRRADQRPVRQHRAGGRVLGAVVVRRRRLELDLQLARRRRR